MNGPANGPVTIMVGKVALTRSQGHGRYTYTCRKGLPRTIYANPEIDMLFDSALVGSGVPVETKREEGTMPATNVIDTRNGLPVG